jgi:transcriptional regulator with XRE-family HTH domain
MSIKRNKTKERIARKVRELRKQRRWTQAELARRLGLSQSRLSEIERGAGSFSAEQFLTILSLFNVYSTRFSRQAIRPIEQFPIKKGLFLSYNAC